MPLLGGRNLEDACGCGIVQNEGSVFPCGTPAVRSMDEIDGVRIDLAGSERCRRHVRAIRFFDERTRRMLRLRDVVILDEAICAPPLEGAHDYAGCDRTCFFFWKEAWLERIPPG